MKSILLTCSEYTLLDANTNRVSLINIHDEVASPQFPFLIPLFSVLAITKKEGGEPDESSCTVRITLGGKVILETPILINYQGADTHRAMVGLHGLVITEPGALTVQLLHDAKEIGAWEVPIRQLTPAVTVNGQQS